MPSDTKSDHPADPVAEETSSTIARAAALFMALLSAPAALAQQSYADLRALTPIEDTYPVISSDGRYLVYSTGEGFERNLVRRDLDDGSEILLTEIEFEDSAPDISPDGTREVFQREDLDGNRDLWIVDMNGEQETNVTRTPGIREQHPRFGPDGRSVVHDTNRYELDPEGGNDGIVNYEIALLDLDSGEVTRLTTWDRWDMYPSLNASGRLLVWRRDVGASSEGERDFEIFALDLETGRAMNLTNSPTTDTNPHVSPADGSIVFASDRTGSYELFLMDADGSDLRRITNGASASIGYFRPTFSRGGAGITANRSVRGVTDMVEIEVPARE